jgi:hypothetical protein
MEAVLWPDGCISDQSNEVKNHYVLQKESNECEHRFGRGSGNPAVLAPLEACGKRHCFRGMGLLSMQAQMNLDQVPSME